MNQAINSQPGISRNSRMVMAAGALVETLSF